MKIQDFSTTILVPRDKEDVFRAITNVRGWWDRNIVGTTDQLHAIFIHKAGSVHTCKLKIIECVPGKRIVWLVLENYFSFTKNSHEWEGSTIAFDISRINSKTQVRFTHIGLTPELECYDHCASEWTDYIQHSLAGLILKTKQQPVPEKMAAKTNIKKNNN